MPDAGRQPERVPDPPEATAVPLHLRELVGSEHGVVFFEEVEPGDVVLGQLDFEPDLGE